MVALRDEQRARFSLDREVGKRHVVERQRVIFCLNRRTDASAGKLGQIKDVLVGLSRSKRTVWLTRWPPVPLNVIPTSAG